MTSADNPPPQDPKSANTSKSPGALKRLLSYAKDDRATVHRSVTYSVLNKIFDLAPPALIGAAVDIVVKKQDSLLARWGLPDVKQQLIALGAITVLVWFLESAFEYAHKVSWRNLAQTLQHKLRLDTYGHVQALELAFFEEESTGRLMSVLNDDVNQLERFLDTGANELIQVTTTALVIGLAFFLISPTVAIYAVLPIPFVLWGSFAFQKTIAPHYEALRNQVGILNSLLSNNLSGMAVIKSFTAEAREHQRVQAESLEYQRCNQGAIRLSSAFSPLIRMVIVVGFTATLVFGGLLTIDGQLSVGSYSVMIFLTQRLLWPLTRLGGTFDLYQRAMASTHRILDLLDTPVGIKDGQRQLDRGQVKGQLSLRSVSFAYKDREPVLKDLSLTIEAGQTVAIVGSTGAGKSSLIKLLLRFYDVSDGAIELDGMDIRELRKQDLRRVIGLVSQDVFLFQGSIRENIGYGLIGEGREIQSIAMDDITGAAQMAEAHDFIESFPQAYETQVGERGQRLSGGQKQRLSIARAILKDPPILILDEATSAVDNETEAAIQRSLERVAVGRTTIIIAHRLSTIRKADVIYVLDAGQIVESGDHQSLLAKAGLYAKLWAVQTGE